MNQIYKNIVMKIIQKNHFDSSKIACNTKRLKSQYSLNVILMHSKIFTIQTCRQYYYSLLTLLKFTVNLT